MTLEEQVPKRETCQRLQELGWKDETLLSWNKRNNGKYEVHHDVVSLSSIPAPNSMEIGEVLPEKINGMFLSCVRFGKCWSASYLNTKRQRFMFEQGHENEAEARARLLIRLIDTKNFQFTNQS